MGEIVSLLNNDGRADILPYLGLTKAGNATIEQIEEELQSDDNLLALFHAAWDHPVIAERLTQDDDDGYFYIVSHVYKSEADLESIIQFAKEYRNGSFVIRGDLTSTYDEDCLVVVYKCQ